MAEVHERRDRDTGNAEYDLSLVPTWSILLAASSALALVVGLAWPWRAP